MSAIPPVMVVPQRVCERLERAAEVPFTLHPAPGGVPDGQVVRFEMRSGAPVAVAVLDREVASWRVMARPRAQAWFGDDLDLQWADRIVTAAAAARVTWGFPAGSAYRLLNGAGDGVPGILADVYGDWAVVSALSDAVLPLARLVAQALSDRRVVGRGVVVKRRVRGRAGEGPGVVEVLGEAPPERLVVTEGPWRFEVHLTTGVNVGLFTDMRLERARVTQMTLQRRVLNLFAYTGAFSVAAAGGGASSVTSVDLSEGVLAWARDNFALNGLDAAMHHCVAADAGGFLADAHGRGERFDVVLIDPPSFSTARDGAFSVGRDYATLMTAACRVVAPGGHLWVASNTRGFALTGAAQLAATDSGREARVEAVGSLPPDYPTELADAEARYLQTVLLRLG